ncbi:MAG TPA: ATP-binding cassette domain-containing protein [Gammaproteobacteria bacterium]|nr:ATP-binding cassette domain-containing protein [Gammaproteobacteria bacterium]
MLSFRNLALRRGPHLLIEGATFTLHAGQKVGVTGANGTGKSSLFALIRGDLEPDAGELELPPGLVIAHVAQETPAVERPAIEYVLDGDRELRTVQAELAGAEAAGDGSRQAILHGRLEAMGGYSAPARAARLLDGLGFRPEQIQAPVTSFSGGWRMRLNLAQALMCRSDLLLLDEPTNHLDLDAVLWLEDWLRGYPGTLLLISHDREFLDEVVHHVAHIEHRRVTLYAGNYSDFEVHRAQALAQQQATYERQQRDVAQMRRFVDRFRAKATKARQAQSRLKALARMELIAPAHADSPFHFRFPPPEKTPNPLLQLDEAAAGYAGEPIVSGIGLTLAPGHRLGLIGPNGAGKSTLIKLLAGELEPLAGQRLPAADLRVGYFAQHQLEQLRPQDSPLAHLAGLDPRAGEQALRDFLGGFGYGADRALEPVGPRSGGEKARLVLALLVYQRPNLLLLDEPTNHLDLDMRHALTVALQDFQGALVVVSHDRHLLRTVTDDLLLVADRRVSPFVGDLDDYRRWLADRRRDSGAESDTDARGAANRKDQRRQAAEQRQRLQPLRTRAKRLEADLERLAARKTELQSALADPALYEERRKEELKALLVEQADTDQALAEVEEAWLGVSEELEAAAAS